MAIQFCNDCGDTLPISGNPEIKCDCCGNMNKNTLINVTTVSSSRDFDSPLRLKEYGDKNAMASRPEMNWPSIDENCRFCPSKKVRYTTLQTRGADEGSTVFYFCEGCSQKWKENN
ncbi:hypothetical protein MCOR25_008402 [Pyricularia grisea]|nr:hypothetical protein MCOR25_008402 [Pyricularia grisea]